MGEAKQTRRRHASILAAGARCIYCGGESPADTVEHMPPIIMFDQRQRPKGLEFPTCRECNHGTSQSDQVASLLARTYPDSDSEENRTELKKLLSAASNNVPGLLEEMHVGRAGQKLARKDIPNMPPATAVLRANGPILKGHMEVFGAKLGLALHHELHGSSVPVSGGVLPLYFTNVNAARGELPMEVVELLPAKRTLEQGKKHVREQFEYSYVTTTEGRHSVFYAVFRKSFAIMASTALDRAEFLMGHAARHRVFAPGDFKKKP